MERSCRECGGPMVETDPKEDDVWFRDLTEGTTVYLCEECQILEADE